MKRLIPLLFLLSTLSWGQSTTVTLQVTDVGGQTWNNGSWSVQLVSQPGASNPGPPFFILGTATPVANQTLSGTLSGTGGASLTLVPNASISPAQSTWRFVVCPNATIDCYRQSVIIAGASQNVNLTPPTIQIIGQNGLPPNTLAYTDSEVVSPAQGAQYFNVTSLSQRQWNGSAWINMGGSINLSCSTIGAIVRQSAIGPIFLCDPNATLDGNGLLGVTGINVNGAGTGAVTVQTGTAPSNPPSGNATLYVNSSTGFLSCLNSSGGSCNPSTTSLTFSALTSGVNTAAAMQNGTGSSLAPLNVGQVVGSQAWMSPGLVAPAMTAGATSSGSLLQTHGIITEVTYNTASGETLPSMFTQISTNAAGCTSNCSVTLTAPTLTSGFPSYNVYACEINSGTYPATPCSSPATLVKLASCTNITINCVITVTPSGATQPPTTITAWIQPPNIQPATLVPLGSIPSLFYPAADNNYRPLAGMDYSVGLPLPSPDGTFSFWHRLFINDTGLNISQGSGASGPMKNNLVAIAHLVNGNTTGTGNTLDDRALGVKIMMPTTATGTNNARIMGIYGETWIQGNPTQLGTAPDDGAKGLRWNLADNRTGGSISGGFGAIEGQYSNQTGSTGNFGSCDPCAYGVSGGVTTGNAAINFGGANFASVFARGIGSSAGTSGDGWAAFYAGGPSVAGHSGNAALLQRSAGGTWPTGVNDYFLRSDISGSQSIFLGTLNLPSIQSDGPTLPIAGSVVITGALNVAQFSTTPGGTAGCTTLGGATQFTFKILAIDSNGGSVSSGNMNTSTTCNSNITAVNTVVIQPPNVNVAGIARYDFYFTNAGGGTCNGGACTLGKIGSCTPVASALSRTGGCSGTTTYTGTAGDGVTPSALNSTGSIVAAGPTISTPSGPVSGSWNCTNVTPVTVNANTTADQNMMACTIPANTLNFLNKTLRVYAAGIYSTPAASVSQMTMKAKLCTVSGCGSGTVITPINIQSTALGTVQITNDNFSLHSDITTQTIGASSAYEAHGEFLIDLSTLTTAADSSFGDTNTATVGTIDATGQLFLQVTFAFSSASASNSATQRQLIVDSVN